MRLLTCLLCVAFLTACVEESDRYVAAAEITHHGFAGDGAALHDLDGRTIRVSGFVDPANLYGDAAARAVLAEWWAGEARDAATWSFNVKARESDGPGQSFTVFVRTDDGWDVLLTRIVADARAGRTTEVFVTGTLRTFEAPLNAVTRTGLYLESPGSNEVRLDQPAE